MLYGCWTSAILKPWNGARQFVHHSDSIAAPPQILQSLKHRSVTGVSVTLIELGKLLFGTILKIFSRNVRNSGEMGIINLT